MKVKHNLRVYDRGNEPFTVLDKGMEIDVIEVDRNKVKIEWERADGQWKYGYISLQQFKTAVEQ